MTLRLTTLLTPTQDLVYVFDNVFDSYEQSYYRRWLEKRAYTFGIPGSDIVEDRQQRGFISLPDEADVAALGMFAADNFKAVSDLMGERTRRRTWCNLTSYQLDCHYHVDWHEGQPLTCLYYANTTWERNWGGETLICDRSGETALAVACRPNRIVVFPSRLDHRIANISRHAPPHRFGIVSVWA